MGSPYWPPLCQDVPPALCIWGSGCVQPTLTSVERLALEPEPSAKHKLLLGGCLCMCQSWQWPL